MRIKQCQACSSPIGWFLQEFRLLLKNVTVNHQFRQGLNPKDGSICPEDYPRNQAVTASKTSDSNSSNDKSNDKTFGGKIDGFIVRGELQSKNRDRGLRPFNEIHPSRNHHACIGYPVGRLRHEGGKRSG